MWRVSRFFWNLKNVVRWIPVLWNNFDWDGNYLLEIIDYKLSRMEEYYPKYAHICQESVDKILAEIGALRQTISMLHDDKYEEIAFEEYYQKYPLKDISEAFVEEIDEQGRKVTTWDDFRGDKEKEALFKKCSKESQKQYKELTKLFGRQISKYDNWWD